LVEFSGTVVNNGAQLKWSTATEKNNKEFDLYKSLDGVNFKKVNEQPGKGTSNVANSYSYLDKDFNESAYYKLVQIDLDGKTKAYDDRIVYLKGLIEPQQLIYPNPTRGKLYITGIEGMMSISVADVLGKTVRSQKLNGNNRAEIDLTGLPKGVYMLSIKTLSGQQVKKVIKE
jgi:trimeric autotransporter adhesin